MAKFEGFTLRQMLKNKKALKKFRVEKAVIGNIKKRKNKGYSCPAK